MRNFFKKKNKGFTLIEMLFYIAIFVVLFLVLIESFIVMTNSFKSKNLNSSFTQATFIMERLTSEIRYANGIGSIATTDITLNTKDSVGTPKTVRFVKDDKNLVLYENGVLIDNLNNFNMGINDISFTKIETPKGLGIKVFLRVQPKNASGFIGTKTKDFYNTVILRNSY